MSTEYCKKDGNFYTGTPQKRKSLLMSETVFFDQFFYQSVCLFSATLAIFLASIIVVISLMENVTNAICNDLYIKIVCLREEGQQEW